MARNLVSHAEALTTLDGLAHLGGWLIVGFRAARTADSWRTPVAGDARGFPDRIYIRHRPPFAVLFVEVKVSRDSLRVHQAQWHDILAPLCGTWFDLPCGDADELVISSEVWRWPQDQDEAKRVLLGAKRVLLGVSP